ncbi:hypothetical protein [Candidatus Reidiella endopervernicosa]|uniref:Uncharacterized protein n=1 Tax=Candidatus Reidiella endopervernicosa TaxID=2738883 RepID=A0A6N0HU98_9GAMM|nr:hypothetical protein [Candidatus Reidiella endopervernicosa]QKQ25751.1 hypothetical protein HUE57_05225 [Candidatus Reidiella endopervernicosa]
MIISFICIRPKLRTAIMGIGFAIILSWMYINIYASNGIALQSTGYLTALVTALDQDASQEIEVSPAQALIDRMQQSLSSSGVEVDRTSTEEGKASQKTLMLEQLQSNFEYDMSRRGIGEEWNGSSFQVISWHYTKTLGRYFNNPEEITPMVATLRLAIHVVFVGLLGAMLLLLWGSIKTFAPLLAPDYGADRAAGLLCHRLCRLALVVWSQHAGESLFLRKFVLGIQAQANSKNFTRPFMPSAPRPSCVRCVITSSRLYTTPSVTLRRHKAAAASSSSSARALNYE